MECVGWKRNFDFLFHLQEDQVSYVIVKLIKDIRDIQGV